MIAVAAIGKHNQLGLNGDLPWDKALYPEDLAFLRGITVGKHVIAGGVTFAQLPPSLKSAAGHAGKARRKDNYQRETLLLGGATLFEARYDEIDEMWITHLDYDGEADCFFPEFTDDFEEHESFRISPRAVVVHYYRK